MKLKFSLLILFILTLRFSAFGVDYDALGGRSDMLARADSAIADGRWADAENLLVEMIEMKPGDPGNVLLLSNLGVVRHQRGDDAGALEALNDAAAIAPVSVTILNNRARVLLSKGEKERAIADYERVMQLDSTLSEPYFYRGMVRFSNGDISGAADDFIVLGELSPGSENSILAMAVLHTATGKHAEALDEYKKLVAISPAAEYYSGLIENRLALDQLSEASEDIAEAIGRYPVDPEFYIFRALLNKRLYRYDDARSDARRAVSLGADAKEVNFIMNTR